MAKIYLKYILNGKITINEVPQRWRNEVEKMLIIEEKNR